jgi:hypothetical protein
LVGSLQSFPSEALQVLDIEAGMPCCFDPNQASPVATGGKRRHP